jgi:hypothetical protein
MYLKNTSKDLKMFLIISKIKEELTLRSEKQSLFRNSEKTILSTEDLAEIKAMEDLVAISNQVMVETKEEEATEVAPAMAKEAAMAEETLEDTVETIIATEAVVSRDPEEAEAAETLKTEPASLET